MPFPNHHLRCTLRIIFQCLLSASPERYLRKRFKVISQPIKGTARRSFDLEQDKQLKSDLAQNEKERSENIMIVDLVRNGLSHTATKEVFKWKGIFKFMPLSKVHQMIYNNLEVENTTSSKFLRTLFPMGSMTGAPKFQP